MTHIPVTQLPSLAGPAAWNVILGDAPEYAPLQGAQTADFVIVGGGFAGLSAARRLRQLSPTASIVVLEAGKIAEGAAGRNSGFMIDLPHELTSDDYAGSGDDRSLIALNRQAIDFAALAVAEHQINAHYFDRSGKVNGAASAGAHAHNESYAKHLTRLGEGSEALVEGNAGLLELGVLENPLRQAWGNLEEEVDGFAHLQRLLAAPGNVERHQLHVEDVKQIDQAVGEAKKALAEGDIQAVRNAREVLERASHRLAEVMYQKVSSQPDGGEPSAGGH